MADERHIIDIILKARDDTAAALASATAKLKGFEDATKRIGDEQVRSNEAAKKSYSELSREISVSQQKLGGLIRQISEGKGVTKDQVDQIVELESATKRYVKALSDENATAAQRAQSLKTVQDAQSKLNKSLVEAGQLSKENAAAISAEIVQTQKQIEQARQLQKVQADIHRDFVAQIQERKRAQNELARILNQSEREAQQRREQELQEILKLEKARDDANKAEIRRRNELARILNQSDREAQQRREADLRDIKTIEKAKDDAHNAEIRRKNELARILNQSDREAAQRREADLRDINTLTKARDDAARKVEAQRAREMRLGREYIQQIQQIQRLEQERQRAIEGGDFVQKVQLDFDAAQARAKAAEMAAELKALFGRISINADIDDTAARAHAVEIIAMKELLGRDIKIDVDLDVDAADVARVNMLAASIRDVGDNSQKTGRDVNFLTGLVGSMKEGFDSGSQRIASFDNYLRGLLSLGIAIFFNQLFLLAGAAAGALAALASSALMAGSALAGGLTAGIMQAIPVLGVFATALNRVKQVTEAVQQANLLQQQQSYAGATAARAQASAQDAVVAASERVADANEKIVEAQKKVNDARQEGIDKLRDLIFQERGLSLSVEESEAALRKAAASGDTASLGRSFLRRDESRASLGDVRGEIAERESAGPGASPEIQAAKEQLEDAVQAGKQAERALEQSKRSAAEAAEGVTAAQGKLAFLLAGLSAAERRLYEAIIRLQDVWKGFAKEVSEPLINAFVFAINRVISILQNPAVRSAFTSLSETMAGQFKRIFSAFTDRASIGQIIRFVEMARTNLRPLTDIFINIGKAFMDVGEAAGPALSEILEWVKDITGNVREFFNEGRKSGDLTKFFKDGVIHIKAWGDLLWEVLRLFGAIAGPGGGAQTGLALIRDMAETIRGWADAIGDTDSKTNEFFRRFFRLSRQMIEAMAPVFRAIADEIDKTFTKDGLDAVKGFATFLADVLIPAVGDFARFIGRITSRLGEFTREHPKVAEIAAAFLAATFAATTLLKALTIFGPITRPLGFIAKHFINWKGALELVGKFLSPVVGLLGRFGALIVRFAPFLARFGAIGAGPIALIGGAIVLVLAKLGLLDDLFRAFGKFFTGLWEQISPPIERAAATFKKLFDRVSEGKGAFAALRPVLKAVIDILGFFLEGIGRSIGKVLGGIIDVISGIVEVVVSLLSGDFAGAWEGLKRIITGAVRAVIGVLELFLLRGMGKLFGSIVRGVVSMGKSFIGALIDLGKAAIPAIMRFLIRLPGRIIGWLKDLVFALRNGLGALEVLFRVLGRRILNFVSNGFVAVFNFFKSLPGKLFDFVKGIPDKIVSVFRGLGGAILGAIWEGIGNIAEVGKDIINGIIELLNKAIPNKLTIPGAPDINLPDDPIPKLAAGGPIGKGRYGGGDRRLILAEDGEHMLTKDEVRSAGGHGAIYALRRLLGGGAQGGPFRFQQGGAVGGSARLNLSVEGDLGSFGAQWARMWAAVVGIGQDGTSAVNRLMAQMAIRNISIIERLERVMRRTWTDMIELSERRGKKIADVFGDTFGEVSQAVFRGLRYVGNATNSVLKSLDADPIKLNLNAPRKAEGGPVGNWGERGRDNVLTYLGKGEAVLNWGQQALVNAFLPGQSTLQSLLASSYGYHAGGPGSSPGYATGRDAIVPVPGFPNEMAARKILDEIAYYTKRFGLILTDAFGPNHKSPGHTTYGTAADLAGSDRDMDRAVMALVRAGYKVLYDGRFGSISYPGHGPSTVAGDNAHIHVEFGDLSRNLPGGDVTIKRAKVEGPDGPLRAIAQALIDRVRGKANDLLESMVVTTDDEGAEYFDVEGGLSVAKTIHEVWQRMNLPFKALLSAIETGIVESGLKNLPGGDLDSVGWRQERGHYGSQAERMNVAHGAQRFFNEWQQFADPGESAGTIAAQVQRPAAQYRGRYDANEANALRVINSLGVDAPGEFATGGQVGGSGAVPIIAHAGEWVVNQMQQSKIATALGVSISKLRDMLGFRGGPGSFAGGGVISPDGMWEWDEVQQRWVPRSAGQASLAMLPVGGGGGYGGPKQPVRQDLPHGTPGNVFIGGERLRPQPRPPSRPPPARPPATQPSTPSTASPTTSTAADAASSAAEAGKKAAEKIAKPFNLLKSRLESIAKGEYEAPAVNPRALAAIDVEIRRVFRAIRNIDGKGKLEKYLKNIGFITDQDGLLDQLGAGIERLAGRLERTLALAQVGLKRVGDRLIKGARLVDPAEIATITIENLDRVREALRDERGVAEKGLAQVDRRLKNLRKGGVTSAEKDKLIELTAARTKFLDTLNDLDGKIAENRAARYQAQLDRFQANLAKAERVTELKMRDVEFSERQLSVDEKFGGDRLGFAQRKIGISQDRSGALGAERTMLEEFKKRAEKLGDVEAIEDLTDRLAENAMAIKEEEASRRELVLAYRQTATDIITGAQERSTGLIGTASGIIQKLGDISGNLDIDKLKGFLEQTAEVLRKSAGEIFANVQSAAGSGEFGGQAGGVLSSLGAAFQAGPESFATKLAELGPLIATLESTMSETERTAFQALIQSMIDNTVATVDNTAATAELTETAVQQWSSTAWQWFREAVFTGTGAVLPEYDVPQMQTGGHVTRGGLFRLHTGEFVANAERSNVAEGETHITINEAGRPLDVTHLASRLSFEKKSRRR